MSILQSYPSLFCCHYVWTQYSTQWKNIYYKAEISTCPFTQWKRSLCFQNSILLEYPLNYSEIKILTWLICVLSGSLLRKKETKAYSEYGPILHFLKMRKLLSKSRNVSFLTQIWKGQYEKWQQWLDILISPGLSLWNILDTFCSVCN